MSLGDEADQSGQQIFLLMGNKGLDEVSLVGVKQDGRFSSKHCQLSDESTRFGAQLALLKRILISTGRFTAAS